MNCKDFKYDIAKYLDGELNSEKSIQFMDHLKKCSSCNLIFEKTRNTLAELKPRERIPEQAFYYTRLKQRMENQKELQESIIHQVLTKKLIQPLVYLASIIIAVYIGILIGSGTTNTNQYSETTQKDTSFVNTYAKYQYVNEIEIESVEKNFLSDNVEEKANTIQK
ncbi:MAG: hypothetical protein A2041_06280 [Bacteroidetes bacterium GWA2_31_9b]|nr:MAG: hypothetical protein A2041_06280 [Bacteroidetes bacterium GWA2_31_9b]